MNEVENLPQVLVMENVPQVHSQANMQDFQKWIEFLESKGYSNYWEDLNAKDYGVAQNREYKFLNQFLRLFRFYVIFFFYYIFQIVFHGLVKRNFLWKLEIPLKFMEKILYVELF